MLRYSKEKGDVPTSRCVLCCLLQPEIHENRLCFCSVMKNLAVKHKHTSLHVGNLMREREIP